MKARWIRTCECCGETISTGSQFVVFAGRSWKTRHLIAYREKRRLLVK